MYVDDLMVKSLCGGEHVKGLEQTFQVLRCHQMKLSQVKGVFYVSFGLFLGYVTRLGLNANPTKLRAVLHIPSLEIGK